jgi:ATP-dependent Clp protease ATP-binding subunit ClpB
VSVTPPPAAEPDAGLPLTPPPTVDAEPTWLRNVDGSLAVRAQLVLWGNVRDQHLVGSPETRRLEPLLDALWGVLSRRGYEFVLVHDPVRGLGVHPDTDVHRAAAGELTGLDLAEGHRPVSTDRLADLLAVCDGSVRRRFALVLDQASRLAQDPEQLGSEEHAFFVAAERLAQTSVPVYLDDGDGPSARHNVVFWVVEREQDLPSWLLAGNEAIRSVAVPQPDLGERREIAALLAPAFGGHDELPEDRRDELVRAFADLTEGMPAQALLKVARLAQDRDLPLADVDDAVRGYTIGLLDNPWRRDHLRAEIADGEPRIERRVLGQPAAVRKSLDILQRSAMGLSGAQASGRGSKPRGVLFLAGPTGVGKTELAKTLTTLVFGNEQAYLRFDMSEYSSEHAEARLIGSPPGYVGYDAGGQLTDGVRRRPFSLLLFDEVEKAAPRILDKFLQILDDGRLTDGRGTTVHFSETLIVFTSNLGVSELAADGSRRSLIDPDMPYEDIDRTVRDAIERHFKFQLNRPELLNRLGDNIVVFDFIRPEVAARIFDLQVANVRRRVADEHDVDLHLAPDVHDHLRQVCTADLHNGGRGIGSAVETALVNPLARSLFGAGPLEPGTTVTIAGVRYDAGNYHLELV